MSTVTGSVRRDTYRSTGQDTTGGDSYATETLSSQKYADKVARLASRTIEESLYPGTNFYNLSQYLRTDQERFFPDLRRRETSLVDDFSFVTTHRISAAGAESLQNVRSVEELSSLRRPSLSASVSSRIVFMHGLPSPQWLNAIGAQYSVDPEFYRRHLDFHAQTGRPDYFTMPPMPSEMNSIIRLCVTTIGHVGDDHKMNRKSLETRRETSARQMEKYLSALRRDNWSLGESLVRDFDIHDESHWSLEQRISLCVAQNGNEWTGIAWTDCGRLLGTSSRASENEKGPWLSQLYISEIFPVIQQGIFHSSRHNVSSPKQQNPAHNFQSALLLHKHLCHSKEIDPAIAILDAFYAFSEIFCFIAASELQFLNMLRVVIQREIHPSTLLHQADPSISNLLYSHMVLDRHIQYISETISAIENRKSSRWPRASLKEHVEIVDTKATTLLADFRHLLAQAHDLSTLCDKGMTITMNNASIQESRRAVWQAEATTRLTRLAFVFIPLSYTASFFGMNFKELSDPVHSLWVYFAASVPVLTISYLFLQLDFVEVWRNWSLKRSSRNEAASQEKLNV